MQLGAADWRSLLEVAEASMRVPGNEVSSNVLQALHAVTVSEVIGSTKSGMSAGDGTSGSEPGCLVELLCDYLDLVLVPATLRRPSLREDAIRCPCGRCLGAAQALQRLQHSRTLGELLQASVLPLLCVYVECAAGLAATSNEVREDGVRAAECLAVFATCARLQEGLQFDIPPRALNAVLMLTRSAPPFASPHGPNGFMTCTSSMDSGWSQWSGPALLGVVHVLRNVAGNHDEVLKGSSEALAGCSRQVWEGLQGLASEAGTSSRRQSAGHHSNRGARARLPGTAPSYDRGQNAVTSDSASSSQAPRASGAAIEEDGTNGRSISSAAATIQRDSPRSTSTMSTTPAAVAHATTGATDFRNPQESDECECSEEALVEAQTLVETPLPKQQPSLQNVATAEVEDLSRQRSLSPDGSSTSAATESSAPRKRCAEVISLFSLAMQALYQTDESLRQPGVFTSEDAVRWQLVALAQPLRVAVPSLPAKWQERLAFHGLRLYLLISRSSHTRRQYAVLQRPFVDSERRLVAFLLSLTPPSQRCCVLLRAMAQDVNSWLAWQAQAQPNSLANRSLRAPAASTPLGQGQAATSTSGLPSRPRRRRTSSQLEGSPSVASSSKARQRSPKHRSSGSSATPRSARGGAPEGGSTAERAGGGIMFREEAADLARLFSAESGEAVWLVHAVLMLAFVLCLLAIWHSLGPGRGKGGPGRVWGFEF